MIELKEDRLIFSFPEVHPDAVLTVDFQRTLRIPDDDKTYPLPPGLGCFPVHHVDDHAAKVPENWMTHGGVMLPLYQSEALWINFSSLDKGYPFAVKVAAGKINAVTGEAWQDDFERKPQDYLVVPGQPWLDGFCVEKGVIRQFVAMPLGGGYSAEEQITGEAAFGGLQIAVCPMKREAAARLLKRRRIDGDAVFDLMAGCVEATAEMALAPGGRMRQEIYDDPHAFADWDFSYRSRCFVNLANSLTWRAITGANPPTVPPTSIAAL